MNNDRFVLLLKGAISRRENRGALQDILRDVEEALKILKKEQELYDHNDAMNKRDAAFAVAGTDEILRRYPV